MDLIWMNNLIQRTLRDDEDIDALHLAGLTAFLAALARLVTAGFTAAQLQWFIGMPFRRFGDDERFKVQLLALALERGTDRVENWQIRLFNAEFWSRLHGNSEFFPADPLPDPAAICRAADLPPELAPVSFPSSSVTRTAGAHLPRPANLPVLI